MNILDIGEVARQANVTASTLRYYEAEGLITSISRHGLRRQFAPDVMTQLAVIALGKTAGFSLAEIKGMFGRDGQPDLSRPVLHAKVDALDVQIRKLTLLKKVLKHVADCPAPSHMECPKFQRLVRRSIRS